MRRGHRCSRAVEQPNPGSVRLIVNELRRVDRAAVSAVIRLVPPRGAQFWMNLSETLDTASAVCDDFIINSDREGANMTRAEGAERIEDAVEVGRRRIVVTEAVVAATPRINRSLGRGIGQDPPGACGVSRAEGFSNQVRAASRRKPVTCSAWRS